jgi:tetratricopeptide (TPR) repeat protein
MVYRMHVILFAVIVLLSTALAAEDPPPPAGVEQQSVDEADSLAKLLFGDEKKEERGRVYYEHGQEDFNAGEEFVKEADSLRAAGADTTMKLPGGLLGIVRQAFGDSTMSSYEQDTRTRAEAAFKAAKKNFERAIKESPEMKEVELWLAATYERLKEWQNAVNLYREILNVRQGEDRLWFNYGYAALQGGQYENAITGFDQAMRIHELITQDPDSTPNRYRIFAGEAYLKTYQDGLALKMFRDAQAHADSATAKELQKTIDWILWDDGGIATVEYRDAAYKAEAEQDWNAARIAYLGGISSARTEKARDHLSFRLALVQFNYGAKSEALERMKQLAEVPAEPDSEHVESYGRMLFSYAKDLEAEGDRRGALSYFLHSTKIPWTGQGAGFVAIAQIASNDIDQAISHAERALAYPLTNDQRKTAYGILTASYRTKGNWEMMRKYQELLESSN